MTDFNDALSRQEPPSAEALAQARRHLTQQKAVLERRKRQILHLSWAGICLGFIIMGVSLYFGWPFGWPVVAGTVTVTVAAAAAAVTRAGTAAVTGAGVVTAVAAVAGAAATAGIGAGIVAAAVAGAAAAAVTRAAGVVTAVAVVAGTVATAGTTAVTGAGIVTAAVTGAVAAVAVAYTLFEKHIEKPLNAAGVALDALVELEATDKPDECIQMDEWREQDEAIGAYLSTLATLGRKPVVGEYRAAKKWMDNAEKRQQKAEKLERARQACARFASQTSANA